MSRSPDRVGAPDDLVTATKYLADLAAANPAFGASPFAAALPAVRFEYWQQRLLDITAELGRTQDLRAVRLAFIGDSITDFWLLADSPGYPGQKYGRQLWDESFGAQAGANRALNLGISGDRTEHVLHRILPRDLGGLGELDAPELDPDFVMLMIGINNSWGGEEPLVDSVHAGIRAVVEAVHALRPRAFVILHSLLPTNELAKNRDVVAPVNALLADLGRTAPHSEYLCYLDLHSAFMDARGEPIDAYYADGLHPNEAGYRVWRDLLVPIIAKLRNEAAAPVIDATALCELPPGVRDFDWTEADYRRYAACVGGEGFMATFPTVVAWISSPTFAEIGIDPVHALHAAQRIQCASPVNGPRRARVESRVVAVRDKGLARGAIVTMRQRVLDRGSGELIATLTTTCFGRKEGGCGNAGGGDVSLRPVPVGEPDATFLVPTSVDLARSYSRTGDANPLHTDPAIASAAGFPRPILHGLCGLGIAGRIAVEALGACPGCALALLEGRFTAPVYPGDTLAIDVWHDGDDVAFRVRVPERGSVAISAGFAQLR